MIWQNAWAFAGLLLLVLPVLIHLLSRKRAVLQRFPSLRFLDVTRLLPSRSPNLSDIPLLLVRLAIVAAAVFALAQPLYVSATRRQSLNATRARVIVVDTSRSTQRVTGGSKTIADSARALADQLGREASASVVLQTADVSRVLTGAAAWLAMQPGRGEIVILSDFQRGVIDSATVSMVPAQFGLRPIQIGSSSAIDNAPLETTHTSVTAGIDAGQVSAEWTDRNTHDPGVTMLELYAAVIDELAVSAVMEAVRVTASPVFGDSTKRVGIVYPRASEAAAFHKDAKAPSEAWMARTLISVHENALLASSAADESVSDTAIAAPFAVVISNSNGAPVVFAAEATVNGQKKLLFFYRGSPSGITSAALISAAANAVGRPFAFGESETVMLTDATLKTFERAPQDLSQQGASGEQKVSTQAGLSDGRWLWLLALLLLGVETWMRRAATRDVRSEVA